MHCSRARKITTNMMLSSRRQNGVTVAQQTHQLTRFCRVTHGIQSWQVWLSAGVNIALVNKVRDSMQNSIKWTNREL